MKIGTYLVRGPGTPEDRMRIMRDAGFDFICFGKSLFTGDVTPEMCARAGIGYDNVHLTGEQTTSVWFEGEEGDAVAERYCREIEMASKLDVHTGIVHVTWGAKRVPPAPGETGRARFERIAECAARNNFTVAIENSVFPPHIHYVLGSFGSPVFGHCFDSGHQNAFARDEDFLGRYGDRLVATHLHDNDGKRDLHIMPFDGTVDWDTVAAKLAATAYARGCITSEFGGAGIRKLPGLDAEEIRRELSVLKIADTDLAEYHDGYVDFYSKLGYEELIARLYERMKRLADMIEAVKK